MFWSVIHTVHTPHTFVSLFVCTHRDSKLGEPALNNTACPVCSSVKQHIAGDGLPKSTAGIHIRETTQHLMHEPAILVLLIVLVVGFDRLQHMLWNTKLSQIMAIQEPCTAPPMMNRASFGRMCTAFSSSSTSVQYACASWHATANQGDTQATFANCLGCCTV